jgi:hypothetical protein
MTDKLITADASKVSGAAFLDAILGITHEQRAEQRQQDIERCIRAIVRGDTYGYPPVFVNECRAIMAEREALGEQVARDLTFTIADMKRKAA